MTLRAGRDAVIAEYGPWAAVNIHLGDGVYTMDHDRVGTGEFMVHAVVQAVADLVGKPLDGLRVLDLACGEGGYSIEFGLHGATVVGLEGRLANLAKARFAASTLGLHNVDFVAGDVRRLSEDDLGRFDVVLCLGILYHLPAEDAVRLVERCSALCDVLTVIRSAVGLSANFAGSFNGYSYRGRRYAEDVGQGHASLDNTLSILPTRTSLLNLLADVGFSSVLEIRSPAVPGLEDLLDSVTLVARRNQTRPFRSIPGLDEVLSGVRRPERRGPAWLRFAAHPQQGLYWRLRERALHTVRRTVWESHRSVAEWQAAVRNGE